LWTHLVGQRREPRHRLLAGACAEGEELMAVTKRTRFEVLRRDRHACRYCGASAPEATLTVDHVTPVALGGTDDPSNLVAACRDCNYGKSSSSPDAELVADVAQRTVEYAAAIGAYNEA